MAIHLLRDYLTQFVSSGAFTNIAPNLLAIFCRRVLGYTYVGDTNFNINSVGTLLIATADSTPTVAPTFAVGTKAGINQGTTKEYHVWIPPASITGGRNVVGGDIGRIIVLRSTTNPRFSSGPFVITGFESLTSTVSNASNATPIQITTVATNTLVSGQTVVISGVTGNTNANGTFTVTRIDNTNFTLNGTTGNGTGSTGSVVTNNYIVDYRTAGIFPPQEAFDSMNWYLYEKDQIQPAQGAANTQAAGTYRGSGNSTTARLILQSPHALAWQVRICVETDLDSGQGSPNCPSWSASPGFGGNSAGDYPTFGQHQHTAMWYNSNNNIYSGGVVGGGHIASQIGANVQYRITMIGDDTGQSVALFARRPLNGTEPRSYWASFGLPDNEPAPLPTNPVARLYAIGSARSDQFADTLGNIVWGWNAPAFNTVSLQGSGSTLAGVPTTGIPSLWCHVTGNTQNGGNPIFDGNFTDSPWISATELMAADLVVGTLGSYVNQASTLGFPFEPRVIGTVPHVRAGRANFGEYATSTDGGRGFQHMRNGIYMIWGGPQVIP